MYSFVSVSTIGSLCREVGVLMETASLFVVVLSMLSIGGSIGPIVRSYDLCEKSEEGHVATVPNPLDKDITPDNSAGCAPDIGSSSKCLPS